MRVNKLGKASFAADVLLSMSAFTLPIIAIYFFVQPGMAKVLGSEAYGIALTSIAVVQFLDSSFIGALSNIRLLQSGDDDEPDYSQGTLLAILPILVILMFLVSALAELVLGYFSLLNCMLTGTILISMSCFDYLLVEFRIKINYRKIVFANTLLIVGLAIGFCLFEFTRLWQLIYIVGYSVGLIYPLFENRPWNKIRVRHDALHRLLSRYAKLSMSNLMTYLVAYGDRLILFPLAGASSVSLYAAAAVASKAVSFVTTPLSSVLLSYLVKISEIKIAKRRFIAGTIAMPVLIAVVCLVFLPISWFLSSVLYPQWFNEASHYIAIIVIAITIGNFANIANSIILRFAGTGYQAWISATRMVVFLVLGLVLTASFGLLGF